MILIIGSDEQLGSAWLLGLMKGKYAQECLEKIRVMNGQIVVVDFDWTNPHGPVENVYYEIGQIGNRGYARLSTNDICVSWGACPQWDSRDQMVSDLIVKDEERRQLRERNSAIERAVASNLVTL